MVLPDVYDSRMDTDGPCDCIAINNVRKVVSEHFASVTVYSKLYTSKPAKCDTHGTRKDSIMVGKICLCLKIQNAVTDDDVGFSPLSGARYRGMLFYRHTILSFCCRSM